MLTEVARRSHSLVLRVSSESFSLVTLLTNVLSAGGGVSVEVAGCGFPDGFDDSLVVIHDHQEEEFGYYSSLSPRY